MYRKGNTEWALPKSLNGEKQQQQDKIEVNRTLSRLSEPYFNPHSSFQYNQIISSCEQQYPERFRMKAAQSFADNLKQSEVYQVKNNPSSDERNQSKFQKNRCQVESSNQIYGLFLDDQYSSGSGLCCPELLNQFQLNIDEEYDEGDSDRSQSRQYEIEDEQEDFIFFKSKNTFEKYLKEFEESNFDFMYSRNTIFCQEFQFILDNWSLCKFKYENMVQRFLDLARAKIFRIQYSDKIYSNLFRIVCVAEQILGYKGSQLRVRQNIWKKQIDAFFQHYINYLVTKSTISGRYYIQRDQGEQKELFQLIEQKSAFYKHPWPAIFQEANFLIRKNDAFQEIFANELNLKEKVDQTLYQRSTPNLNNLMGTSFLIKKANIFDPTLSDCLISLGGMINNLHEEQHQKEFLKELVGLLNAGGGIILFDTRKNFAKIEPIGEIIFENKKLAIENQIKELSKKIEPEIQVGIDFNIDFIPVIFNPYNSKIEESSEFKPAGHYVTAVKVIRQPHLDRYKVRLGYQYFQYQKQFSLVPASETSHLLNNENKQFEQKLKEVRMQKAKEVQNEQNKIRLLAKDLQIPEQLHKNIYLILKETQEKSSMNKMLKNKKIDSELIEKVLFHSLPLKDLNYQEYSERIIILSRRYQEILQQKYLNKRLFEQETDITPQNEGPQPEKLEQYLEKYVQLRSKYLELRQNYVSLSIKNKNNILNIFMDYIYQPSQHSQSETFSSLFMLLEYFQKVLIQNRKELEKAYENYTSDYKYIFIKKILQEESVGKIDQHYQSMFAHLKNYFTLLEQYHFILIDIWKNVYFFQSFYSQEDPPMIGKPQVYSAPPHTIQRASDMEKIFPRASGILCRKQDLETTLQKLEKYDIFCKVASMPACKVKGCATTWVIYHHNEHRQVMDAVKDNPEFFLSQKQVVAFPITNYIQLKKSEGNPLSSGDFQDLLKYLKSSYPTQTMSQWSQSLNGVTNYYISTESYASTMFIYLILAHFGEKGDFKDPKFVRERNSLHPNLDLIFPVPPNNMGKQTNQHI